MNRQVTPDVVPRRLQPNHAMADSEFYWIIKRDFEGLNDVGIEVRVWFDGEDVDAVYWYPEITLEEYEYEEILDRARMDHWDTIHRGKAFQRQRMTL